MPTTVEIYVERRPGGVGQPSEVDAFADLYNRTFNPLVAYCRRYCPPGYDAEDIAQEALAKAWSSWDRYSPSRPFWPWVATIARRLCVDYWRRDERAGARVGSAAALEASPQPRPDELSEAADECRMAVTAFRGLRPDHQRIVGLRDIEGWSYEDIARFEGVTVESIRGSLRRARMSLRKSYDSLAKGGVAALVPGGAGFMRLFQDARARMSARMASWQANLQDAGVASSRLGEVLVSLVALSVAAVGLGSTSPADTRALNDRASAAAPAALATDGGASVVVPSSDGAGGAGSGGSAVGAAATGSAASGVWKGRYEQPTDAVPFIDTEPHELIISDIAPSPRYASDKTLFANGSDPTCLSKCRTVFKSVDGGKTWSDLRTVGLVTPKLIIPPNYPDDPRIFATGDLGFQVSYDGGLSFATVSPSWGIAAMSPAYAKGDPRILLPDSAGMQYNARLGVAEPMSLSPAPATISKDLSFGFPTNYDPARPVVYVGAILAKGTRGMAAFYRCEAGQCGPPVELPGIMGLPRIAVVPTPRGDAVWAYGGSTIFRSFDGGRTFDRVAPPTPTRIPYDDIEVSGGRIYAVVLEPSKLDADELWYTDDAGDTWHQMSTSGIPSPLIWTISRLSDGTILLGMGEGGFACTHDHGRTWFDHC